jgi:TPR repeat protein
LNISNLKSSPVVKDSTPSSENLPAWHSAGAPTAPSNLEWSNGSFTRQAATGSEGKDQKIAQDNTFYSACSVYSDSSNMLTSHHQDRKNDQAGFDIKDHISIGGSVNILVNDSTLTNPHSPTQGPATPQSDEATQNSSNLQQARIDAARGVISGMLDLGNYYYHGEGGASQSFSLAMTWFQRAATFGSAEAQFNIATMYEQGTVYCTTLC